MAAVVDQRRDAAPEGNSVELRERLTAIVQTLEQEAEQRVSKRQAIERRWLEDLEQYHGQYPSQITNELRDAKKSTLFINATRPKTNAMEARLSDMLFPTDDRNWGIGPTPVPELTVEAEQVAREAANSKKAAVENPADEVALQRAKVAEESMVMIQARLDEAKKRARSMEEEIADHLKACDYAAQCRDVIRDGVRIGTGVIKGPMVGDRSKRSWQLMDRIDEQGNPVAKEYGLGNRTDTRPAFWRVDPWGFFPDPDATSMDDCEGVYERHLMTRKQLRRLARQPGFDPDTMRALLNDEPRSSTPTYIADLRSITGSYQDTTANRYHVWEYHGPLSKEQLVLLATMSGDQDTIKDLEAEPDPLMEVMAVVWFCQGRLLKFGVHPLDSGDGLYSVFNLEEDEASIFGFGVPFLMRDSQSALAAAWRTMMDNAGLSSGPQLVVDKEFIEPVDGVFALVARKLWYKKPGAPPNYRPFESFDIPSHQVELANIIELARKNIDEETSMPMIAQGEQGAQVTKTAQGMGLLMNSANVVFRRVVKNWDDNITTPNISRLYDWLMQFSPKEHIKGDFEVDARGTSVLLVKEMQVANLMTWLLQFVGHPILGRFVREDGLLGLRRLAQAMLVPADELVKSDDEIAEDEAEAAENPPPPNPEMEKIAAELNRTMIETESRKEVALINRETALIQLAHKSNIDIEKLREMLADKQRDRDSKERIVATEAALTAREGASGGGYF